MAKEKPKETTKTKKALTGAERQARYRKSRLITKKGFDGEFRLNTWIAAPAHFALMRLAVHLGVTQKQILERLITEADKRITDKFDLRSPEWKAYYDRKRKVTQ